MKWENIALIAGGGYLAWKVLQTSRDVSGFIKQATPLVNDAAGTVKNVNGITGSIAGISNAAAAVANGLASIFKISGSAPIGSTFQPSAGAGGGIQGLASATTEQRWATSVGQPSFSDGGSFFDGVAWGDGTGSIFGGGDFA